MNPYWTDGTVTLYHGRMQDVLPALGQFDACVTDPPYGETSLAWDRWPTGWPALVAEHTSSMWCFGSMRMFLERRDEFGPQYLRDDRGRFRKPGAPDWRLSQDVVWEKHNGTGFAADRLKRVHELALHWYQGDWRSVHHAAPREDYHGPDKSGARRVRTPHTGAIGSSAYEDDGTRMVRSVIKHPSVRGGLHPTEKPPAVLAPLIEYAVPSDGVVLDPFAGSCSTGLTARQLGRRAVLVEADEAMCEKAAARLDVPDLFAADGAR